MEAVVELPEIKAYTGEGYLILGGNMEKIPSENVEKFVNLYEKYVKIKNKELVEQMYHYRDVNEIKKLFQEEYFPDITVHCRREGEKGKPLLQAYCESFKPMHIDTKKQKLLTDSEKKMVATEVKLSNDFNPQIRMLEHVLTSAGKQIFFVVEDFENYNTTYQIKDYLNSVSQIHKEALQKFEEQYGKNWESDEELVKLFVEETAKTRHTTLFKETKYQTQEKRNNNNQKELNRENFLKKLQDGTIDLNKMNSTALILNLKQGVIKFNELPENFKENSHMLDSAIINDPTQILDIDKSFVTELSLSNAQVLIERKMSSFVRIENSLFTEEKEQLKLLEEQCNKIIDENTTSINL